MGQRISLYVNGFNRSFILLSYLIAVPLLVPFFYSHQLPLESFERVLLLKHFFAQYASISAVIILGSLLLATIYRYERLRSLAITMIGGFSLFQALHYSLYGIGFNEEVWFTVFESSFSEAFEYVGVYLRLTHFGLVIAFVATAVLINHLYDSIFGSNLLGRRIILFGIIIMTTAFFGKGLVKSSYWKDVSMFSFISSYQQYHREMDWLEQSQLNCGKTDQLDVKDPSITIIVVGESTSKFHLSLYGYDRLTCPKLSERLPSLNIYDHVTTDAVHTNESLKQIFLDDEKCSLIQSLNQQGYQTVWLSNQAAFGRNERITRLLSEQANEAIYVREKEGLQVDEIVFPYLKSIVKEVKEPTVIFVHFMGTHLDYYLRYPKQFQTFVDAESPFGVQAASTIDHYDNAILYNDFLIDSMIRMLETQELPSSLLYFSDHGDEVYDYRNFVGHHQGLASKYMKEVPFLVWESGTRHSLSFQHGMRLNSFTDRFLSWINGEDTVGQKAQDSSLISLVQEGLGIQEEPEIWAHRCNSVSRIKEIEKEFEGFEMDVYWNGSHWEVNHPPSKGSSLTLGEFFTEVDPSLHHYWLDVKNLNAENLSGFLIELEKLKSKGLSYSKLIVETEKLEFIEPLAKAGLRVSLYLPGRTSSQELLLEEYESIAQDQRLSSATYVSQDLQYLEEMENHFPNHQILTWYTSYEWQQGESREKLLKILRKHPRVKNCLINFPSESWR